ncbi:helix-turn-helix domain-containing protein [Bifidobacterium aerophilum]|uniref:Helix-turn-helix domain-containing protein n=1 Tax=Bifidobacterium aerophilum TaxID=1798155 RepID=A0A6N9Z5S8_9BIFI|nr:helix-turn-helix domain-containing protein [Bifidobacterium aerophilum]
MSFESMRVQAGYAKRKDLSERCGVSVQRLHDWETGFRDPRGISLRTAHEISSALGITLDDFWNGLNE